MKKFTKKSFKTVPILFLKTKELYIKLVVSPNPYFNVFRKNQKCLVLKFNRAYHLNSEKNTIIVLADYFNEKSRLQILKQLKQHFDKTKYNYESFMMFWTSYIARRIQFQVWGYKPFLDLKRQLKTKLDYYNIAKVSLASLEELPFYIGKSKECDKLIGIRLEQKI